MRLGRYLTSLTKPELEKYINGCNFSDDEETIFTMLSKNKSIVEISEKLGMSESATNRRIAKIKRKGERFMVVITRNGKEIKPEDVVLNEDTKKEIMSIIS